MKLCMFRTVRLSIIRSLFSVHSAMVYVIQVCKRLSSRTRMFHPGPARKLSTNLYDIYLSFRAGTGCSILVVLDSCLQTCMAYTSAFELDQDVPSWSCSKAVYKPVWHIPQLSSWIRMFHPGRAR